MLYGSFKIDAPFWADTFGVSSSSSITKETKISGADVYFKRIVNKYSVKELQDPMLSDSLALTLAAEGLTKPDGSLYMAEDFEEAMQVELRSTVKREKYKAEMDKWQKNKRYRQPSRSELEDQIYELQEEVGLLEYENKELRQADDNW